MTGIKEIQARILEAEKHGAQTAADFARWQWRWLQARIAKARGAAA